MISTCKDKNLLYILIDSCVFDILFLDYFFNKADIYVAETLITVPYGQRSSTVLPTPLNSRHRSVNNKKKQSFWGPHAPTIKTSDN